MQRMKKYIIAIAASLITFCTVGTVAAETDEVTIPPTADVPSIPEDLPEYNDLVGEEVEVPGEDDEASEGSSGSDNPSNENPSNSNQPGNEENSTGSNDVDDDTTIPIINEHVVDNVTFYEAIENEEEISLNLSDDSIDEMNQKGNGVLYIESKLGAFVLPIGILKDYTKQDGSQVQVTIRKLENETLETIDQMENNWSLDLVGNPVDFSVEVVIDGSSKIITSYGQDFVERRIPISESAATDDLVVIVLNLEEGTYQPVPTTIEKDKDGQYWAVFHRNGNSVYAVSKTNEKNFTDVIGHWAEESIKSLSSKLILKGVNEEEFKPDITVSRSEFAAMLTRAVGLVSSNNATDKFKDVASSKWYYEDVYAAHEVGIINGYGNGNFGPLDSLTREEMIVMAVRALKLVNGEQSINLDNLSKYTDQKDISNWALKGIAIAIDNDLVQGRTLTTIAPKGTVTRVEAAVVIERLLSAIEF